MNTADTPREPETLTCDICLKDIPISEARSEEAVDYVLHFCGLDCYSRWKARDAPATQVAIAEDTPAQQGDNTPPGKRDGAAIELPVVWQRLVAADGRTCVRCNATRQELERAMRMLREVLSPLRIEPVLYT
ncbi:MAG TPA: DUF3330 domain-containing protein, partial [Burkholderiales bacterium]|nr:DUF3330 domain-containing protein [Burkholderiales bacterium]